jgi:L-serine/L-threonine ammonia-lyase
VLHSKIFLKLENLQPSGSFKSRGVGNLVLHYASKHASSGSSKCLHFYSSSGGNAGLGCVTAAASLGFPSSVVVPMSTKPVMIAKLKAAGATEVIQYGESWQYADAYLREEILGKLKDEGEVEGIYVPPFDHPLIWDGNATMIEEIKRQMPDCELEKPDAIICSVGGGGLLSGICQGLDRVGWGDVQILAMETVGADSLAKSLENGERITLSAITSIATSLGAVRVAEQTFKCGQRKNVKSVVLSDAEAAMGAWRLADDQRLLVDPECGVSVVPCYGGRLKRMLPWLRQDSKVVIIACGGSAATIEKLVEWRETYGKVLDLEKEATNVCVVPSSHPLSK